MASTNVGQVMTLIMLEGACLVLSRFARGMCVLHVCGNDRALDCTWVRTLCKAHSIETWCAAGSQSRSLDAVQPMLGRGDVFYQANLWETISFVSIVCNNNWWVWTGCCCFHRGHFAALC